jgi:hypothetical protein
MVAMACGLRLALSLYCLSFLSSFHVLSSNILLIEKGSLIPIKLPFFRETLAAQKLA